MDIGSINHERNQMINSYESLEVYARMNYLIDVVRGNLPPLTWELLAEDLKKMYIEEAKIAEYVITDADMNNIESFMNLTRGNVTFPVTL